MSCFKLFGCYLEHNFLAFVCPKFINDDGGGGEESGDGG